MKSIQLVGVILSLVSTSAWAQESDSWDWKVAPYLWTVGISGDIAIGPIVDEVDMSFGDILSDFELGGSIFAEVGKDKHSVHLDYTYIRLRPDPSELPAPPFPPGSELATKLTVNILETAYNYRFNGTDDGPSLVLGARLMDIAIRMSPGDLPTLAAGPNWWDYFVGVKTHNAISPKWDFDFYGTVGTGGSDLPWTVQAMFGRKFSNGNRLGLGARVWGIDYSENEGVSDQFSALDLTFYGLMLGYEFN